MKIAWRTMAGTGLFVLPFGVIYGLLSGEESGTALLFATSLSLLVLAAYLWAASRRRPPPPEDRAEAELPGEDDLGVFPVASIWPAVLATGAMIGAVGLAYNGWLALPGAGIILLAIGGMISESTA